MEYSGFDVSFSSTSLKIAADIGASPFFNGYANVEGIAVMFDTILRTTQYEIKTMASGFRYCIQSGIGVRIALRMLEVEGDVAMSFAAVAAQTHLKRAKTQYKIEGIGLTTTVIRSLFAIDESGELNEASFRTMTHALSHVLPDYLDPPTPPSPPTPSQLAPQPYTTPLPNADLDDPRLRARGINYAMSIASTRASLETAMKDDKRPPGVSRDLVAFVYSQLTKGTQLAANEMLPKASSDRASNWLAYGRLS